MSELNFLHSNGNKVKLTTPDTLAANKTFKLPGADGSSGQAVVTDGSGAFSFASIPTAITTAGGTMTIGFQDHVAGNTSSTTATGYYQRIGNMVHCAIDTGSINKSGLNSGEILLLTGCFPITRDNNWHISGVSYYDATLPANCFKVEFSGMNLSSSGNSYPIFRVGTSSGIMSGGSDYKFCQNKIGASTAGTFETNSLIYTSGYIAGSSGDVHTTQATFMKCGTGERWTYTSITMEEGNASSQVTVAHPQNGSNALTTIRYLTHDGSNFDSGEISWTCWSTT